MQSALTGSRRLALGLVTCAASTANAGGLLLPGAGAISTSRAGASVADTDDGEAIAINPAGIAKSHGTQIEISAAAIDYFLSFHRAGDYPLISQQTTTYAGKEFPTMVNHARPSLGIPGTGFQPVPVIAVITDLGGAVPGLHLAAGLYALNAYPFRNLTSVNGHPWVFNSNIDDPPPPTRYDVLTQQAAIVLPSLVAAYRVIPDLDIGARFSAGFANLQSSIAAWGLPNEEEWQQQDSVIKLEASALVVAGGFGLAYRPNRNIELAANYTLPIHIAASGTAQSENGPAVSLAGAPVYIFPVPNSQARCAPGGTAEDIKACVDIEIPMTAQLGGRWKFLDDKGVMRGDLELDVGWENWGARCNYATDPTCTDPSDYRVVVDAMVGTTSNPSASDFDLKDQLIRHGFQDTYDVRLGGSWSFPAFGHTLIARGGISYDTAAAMPGWERVDVDGAARTMLAAGASYKWTRFEIDAGFSTILEGVREQNRNCQPTSALMPPSMGCGPGGSEESAPGYGLPGPFREGPDPVNPLVVTESQAEHPVNEGRFDSYYLLFMLGVKYWF
jgi:long-chain fatty acid transport protein